MVLTDRANARNLKGTVPFEKSVFIISLVTPKAGNDSWMMSTNMLGPGDERRLAASLLTPSVEI